MIVKKHILSLDVCIKLKQLKKLNNLSSRYSKKFYENLICY